jgi:hypothetical protein
MLAKTETNLPALPKMKDIYIKIHNATKKMHINDLVPSPQHQAEETNTSWC